MTGHDLYVISTAARLAVTKFLAEKNMTERQKDKANQEKFEAYLKILVEQPK